MKGFGLAPLKKEGAPCHPDTFLMVMTDEMYLKQLQFYADYHGIEEARKTMCSRPHLLEKLKCK